MERDRYFCGYYPHRTTRTKSKILFYDAAGGDIKSYSDLKSFLNYIRPLGFNVASVRRFDINTRSDPYGPGPDDMRISLTRKHALERGVSIVRFEDGVYFAYGAGYMACAESRQELMIRLAADGKM